MLCSKYQIVSKSDFIGGVTMSTVSIDLTVTRIHAP
jgi:hypothetical protein